MNEGAYSNINQILSSFDAFVKIIEDPNWPRSATVEDIKTSFKLGNFLEKTMEHFKLQNSTDQFLDLVRMWWQKKNRTKVYSASFFTSACDELLIKFFRCENISETNLDVAVRIYTSIFPRDRMEKVLSKLILTAGSLEAIADFVGIIKSDDKSAKELEYCLKLQNWRELLETGNESSIKEEIMEMMSVYKVECFLPLLVGVLTVCNVSEGENKVQNIVLSIILEKMLDRSILSKPFWRTLFKKIDVHFIATVCENFKDFMISFFNFIVYTGSMMKKERGVWQSDPGVCLCPEIEYGDLVIIVREVSGKNIEMKSYVNDRLHQAKDFTDSEIWQQIIDEIS